MCKKDVDEINMRAGAFEIDLIGNTKHLRNAANSLPELTARKEVIDKHTNIATALLGEIKERSPNVFTEKENDMMKGGSIDMSELLAVLNEKALNIVDWAEKLYGQSINAVTAGVKNLLSSDQQPGVARAVEALAKGQPNLETDSYLMLDPTGSKTGSSGSSNVKGPFREAIVFMIGGGNYIEYNSLQELLQRQEITKNIIYGATELLTGSGLVEQLALLGRNMGLGAT
ncbi:hypothetical protein Bca101_053381 [Brassica carinata]